MRKLSVFLGAWLRAPGKFGPLNNCLVFLGRRSALHALYVCVLERVSVVCMRGTFVLCECVCLRVCAHTFVYVCERASVCVHVCARAARVCVLLKLSNYYSYILKYIENMTVTMSQLI